MTRLNTHEWTGATGDVWAQEWRRTDRSFGDLADHLNRAIRAAMPDGPARVADVGCGAGATSIATASVRDDVQVVGIDLSLGLLAIAADRAADLPNCTFLAGAVEQVMGALPPFDLIVSRHGVMFFDDPVAGMAAIRAAAKPGANIVFSCFRDVGSNLWASEIATALGVPPPGADAGYAPGPFGFADAAFVRATLHKAGWGDVAGDPVDIAYRAGEGADAVADAVEYFGRIGPAARAIKAASATDRPAMMEAMARVCERHASEGAVDFPAAAWIWTARNPD
ncbi:MAG: class I SAM-dependent methyltransferase [Pseudomonadota bacterium]